MKREKLENAINCYLDTNIALWEVHKTLTKDQKARAIIDKAIRQSRKAKKILTSIKHDEIVLSLFNTLFNGKEAMFVLAGSLLNSKQLAHWDNTEKGFKEFVELEKKGIEEAKAEQERKKSEMDAIAKAKAEGKKIDYVYDPKTKKTKAVIMEDTKANA